MRDALSSLMAGMRDKMSRPGTNSEQGGQRNQNSPENEKSRDATAANSSAREGTMQSGDGTQQHGAPGSQLEAQGAQAMKNGQSPSAGNRGQAPETNGHDPQSGAGRQDGDKNLKEAEELKAIGKLTEIIGKRSASLTGEITSDAPSQSQQLGTSFSNRMGRHTDSGGRINRDEIPLEDQQYVREYMERVHKEANSK
ncbi:MAG: hypothetical protein JOZ22_15890 [Acidobacteriia bacterium]|nr:hypothetical protein [Terriglobia bacterium]